MPNSNLTQQLPDLSSETQSQLCQADVLPAQRGDGNSRDVNVGLVSPHEYYNNYKML